MRRLLSFVLFQAGWFGCVLAGARGLPGAAVAAAAGVVGVHLRWMSPDARRELRPLLWIVLIGFSMDTANLRLGVFSLIGDPRFPHLCPLWLTALWAVFGTLLRGSLGWLAGRYALAALLGAAGGPLSYLAGWKLGAVHMHPNRAFGVAALAVGWAAATPLLVWVAHGRDVPPRKQEAR